MVSQEASDFHQIQGRLSVWFYFVTTFAAAALLFILEPLVGKSLLPFYGGTPAIWNTCVFFFQLVLLIGYVYAHVLHRFLTLQRQIAVHAAVTVSSLCALPIRLHFLGLTDSATSPVASLLFDLATMIGPIFFVVSTTTPLLQAWHGSVRLSHSPYSLYVASNVGSLTGLIVYPTIIEFWLPLSQQSSLMSWGFAGLVGALGICGLLAVRAPSRREGPTSPVAEVGRVANSTVDFRTRSNWFLWSLCPSSLMLGVTSYLSTEIAPMPAIWMVPLGLYLISFIIAFAYPHRRVLHVASICYACLAMMLACGLRFTGAAWVELLLLLFSGSLALNCRLASERPGVEHLTEFYLWISFGGLCGSICNSLIAPQMFNWLAEYPLSVVLGFCLIPWPQFGTGYLRWSAMAIRPIMALGIFVGLSWASSFSPQSRHVIHRERTFFSQFQILQDERGTIHKLLHGITMHGMQVYSNNPRERRPPLTYYFFTGPVGQLILAGRGSQLTQTVGVVGLGVGSLAAYAERGEEYTFYEIDQAISRIALDTKFFTFLSDAKDRGASVDVVNGDARLKLREVPDKHYGLLVLDAFSSDAIPVHLLTKDAIEEYIAKIRVDGAIAFHISVGFVDLEPVLANIAHELGYVAYIQNDMTIPTEEARRGKFASQWLVLSHADSNLKGIVDNGKWRRAERRPSLGIWTDERSNLLSIVRWSGKFRSQE